MKQLFKRDLGYILRSKKYFVLALSMAGLYVILLLLNFTDAPSIEYFFQFLMYDIGMDYEHKEFVLPLTWFIFHAVPVLIITEINYKDYKENGINILLKAKTKRSYYFSKYIASVAANIIFMSIIIVPMAIAIFLMDGVFNNFLNLARIFIFLLLENINLTLIGLLIAFAFDYKISILFLFLNLAIAMLTNIRMILGQYSLVYKQDFMGGDFTVYENLKFIVIYLLAILLISYLIVPKLNYYGDIDD